MKTKHIVATIIGILLYVGIGNARVLQINPFISGATVAINMVAPVLFGILFGPRVGGFVGLIGTALNAFSPAGNSFEMAAIVPHTIMGITAGSLPHLRPSVVAFLALATGHILNLIFFLVFRLLPLQQLETAGLWINLLYELLTGVLIITLLIAVTRLEMMEEKRHFLD